MVMCIRYECKKGIVYMTFNDGFECNFRKKEYGGQGALELELKGVNQVYLDHYYNFLIPLIEKKI
jgi:hypothetical protein